MRGNGIVRHNHEAVFAVRLGVGTEHSQAELEKFVFDSLTKDGWEIESVFMQLGPAPLLLDPEEERRQVAYDVATGKLNDPIRALQAKSAQATIDAFRQPGYFHEEER